MFYVQISFLAEVGLGRSDVTSTNYLYSYVEVYNVTSLFREWMENMKLPVCNNFG
jgi:hypothetical protein